MALVSLTRVRRAHHVDVGHVGIVGFDVALQLVEKGAMRLSWVGKRFGFACLRHTENYADVFGIMQPSLLPCPARWLVASASRESVKGSGGDSGRQIGTRLTPPRSQSDVAE
jgi:hypothetical protein